MIRSFADSATEDLFNGVSSRRARQACPVELWPAVRRKLTQLGLQKIGTVGILLKAKQVGLLSAIRPELEKLHRRGFSLSQSVIDAVLQQAKE